MQVRNGCLENASILLVVGVVSSSTAARSALTARSFAWYFLSLAWESPLGDASTAVRVGKR